MEMGLCQYVSSEGRGSKFQSLSVTVLSCPSTNFILRYGGKFLARLFLFGVPVVVQWLTNSTKNREVAGSIPGLAQWIKDPSLP